MYEYNPPRRRRRRGGLAVGAFGVGFLATLGVALAIAGPGWHRGARSVPAPERPPRAQARPARAPQQPQVRPASTPSNPVLAVVPPVRRTPVVVTLAFAGDIRFPGPPAVHVRVEPRLARLAAAHDSAFAAAAGAPNAWADVRDALGGADVAVANLETAVARSGTRDRRKLYTFRAKAAYLDGARAAGLDVFSLANNHSLDYGRAGLLETIRNVRARGAIPVGAGATEAQAFAPAIVEVRGVRIGFLSFSRVLPDRSWAAGRRRPGVASGYATGRVLHAIDKLRPRVDVLVVLMHWGVERATEPRPEDVKLARAMLESGATIVIGHHPHVLQGMEWSGGSLVAYSLGNFVFPSETPTARESGVLVVRVDPDSGVIGARFLPVRLTAGLPHALAPAARDSALSQLSATLAPAGLALVPGSGELMRLAQPARTPGVIAPPRTRTVVATSTRQGGSRSRVRTRSQR